MSPAIDAKPTHARAWSQAGLELHHMRYRGFAAATHAHGVAQAVIPLAGRMHVVVAGRSHMLAPDAAVWIPAGLDHAFVHVDGQLEFLVVEGGADVPTLAVARSANLRLLAQAIANELDAPGPDTDAMIAACVQPLLAYLARPAADAAPAASPEVAIAIEAVLALYAGPLRVPDLAARAGLSPRQLERRFHAELGRTPKRFLMEVRVGAAEALLTTTDRPIAQIALEVGFQTPSHFTETFKALRGHPPNVLRGG
ncbi:MAG: putative transcriptional regulator, AraC family [Cyanobacteria bacterium RYN_339]|nr:putative transcriptional regulator, AraC family [Cyanobacteria bacterium RYN_339]